MTVENLRSENAELLRRLEEAEDTIRAIRSGDVDALVVERPDGHQVYTLEAADRPYRLFVEEMQQGAATLHTDGTIAWCNRRLAELLKRPQEKLLGAPLRDFIAPEDRGTYENLLWQGQQRAGRGEAQLLREDGGYVASYLTFNALPPECGTAIGVLITDLTAQKHHDQLTAAHNALRESEDRYRSLFDSIDEGFCVIDVLCDAEGQATDYRFLEVNPAFAKQSGLTDAVGKRMLELAPHHETHWFEIYGKVAATGESVRFVNEAKALDGRWFDVFAFRLGGHESRRVAVIFTDITSRRQAELAEGQRSEQVRRLADVAVRLNALHDIPSILGIVTAEARSLIGAHQAVVSFTADDQWAQSNLAVSLSDKYAQWRTYDRLPDGSGIYSLVTRNNQRMRMTQAELEAHPAWKGFGEHAAEHPPMRGWLAVPFRGRWHGNVGLIQLSDKLEGEFTADDEAVIVQLAQMTAVAIDNSRLVEDLRESDRRKTEFLAMLAHELRNPLAPIRNSVQILRLHEGSEPIRAAAEMLERQVGQMVHLVDDLLDVSRISRGKIELRRGRVELAPIVYQAVEAARPLCDGARHKLTVSLPNEPIFLRADPIRLAQVIGNLLSNACKFTNAGGRISLTVERAEGEAVIQVQDNGIGIAPDQLSHIFDMFQQVDTSLERSVSGLGIGLTLVKSLVELHGGKVSANSSGIDNGSTFTVRLPIVAGDSRPTTIPPSRPPQPVSAGLRILIVDDNRDAATSLAMLLKMKGHKTHVAYDGVEAVNAAEAFRPQVAILDIGLPKLNGYDVCRRIREQKGGEQIAIFALTGWGQEEDRQKSKAAGFTSHLVKPVDFAALLKLIGETAGKSD